LTEPRCICSISNKQYIFQLQDCTKDAYDEVGGKALGLCNLLRAGARVPPGFCITTSAFKDFVSHNDALSRTTQFLTRVPEGNDAGELLEISEKVQQQIVESSFPQELSDRILTAYRELVRAECRPVAVRSSATLEDTAARSFAGQHDSFLNISAEEDVLQSIKKVWASYYNQRAIIYRRNAGLNHSPAMGVIIQSIVFAKKSGVLFTVNPSNGDRSSVVIEAVWGLGEGLVSGNVTPDQYIVNKVTLEVEREAISSKTHAYVPHANRGGVQMKELSKDEASARCLSKSEIEDLVQMAKRVEKYLHHPQDIEWACEESDGDKREGELKSIFFLQSRPITTLRENEAKSDDDVFGLVTSSLTKKFKVNT
jgi:pyruvate, water dikinase